MYFLYLLSEKYKMSKDNLNNLVKEREEIGLTLALPEGSIINCYKETRRQELGSEKKCVLNLKQEIFGVCDIPN